MSLGVCARAHVHQFSVGEPGSGLTASRSVFTLGLGSIREGWLSKCGKVAQCPASVSLPLSSFWGHVTFAGVGMRSSSLLLHMAGGWGGCERCVAGWSGGCTGSVGGTACSSQSFFELWCPPAALSPEYWGPSSLLSGGWSGRLRPQPGLLAACLWCS